MLYNVLIYAYRKEGRKEGRMLTTGGVRAHSHVPLRGLSDEVTEIRFQIVPPSLVGSQIYPVNCNHFVTKLAIESYEAGDITHISILNISIFFVAARSGQHL